MLSSIVFATNDTSPYVFGISVVKPTNQKIFFSHPNNPIKTTKVRSFSNKGVTVVKRKITVNSGSGEYKGACGVMVTFANESLSDRYAAYTITLTDSNGDVRKINLVTKTKAQSIVYTDAADMDEVDTSGIMLEEESGVVELHGVCFNRIQLGVYHRRCDADTRRGSCDIFRS